MIRRGGVTAAFTEFGLQRGREALGRMRGTVKREDVECGGLKRGTMKRENVIKTSIITFHVFTFSRFTSSRSTFHPSRPTPRLPNH